MQAYLDYFELTERIGWRLGDLPWNEPQLDRVSDDDRKAIAATSVIESGVPHYAKVWGVVDGFADDWELAQFVTLWAGEEERHNVTLNRLARLVGEGDAVAGDYRRVAETDFVAAQKAGCPTRCYSTIPGMLTYAMIQELVTWRFYLSASKQTKSLLVREAFRRIGEDEMRHHVWYRDALKARHARAPDKAWFAEQVSAATRHFRMPHGIFHVRERFFDVESNVVGKLGVLDIKLRVAKALSFDRGLVAALASSSAPQPLVAQAIAAT